MRESEAECRLQVDPSYRSPGRERASLDGVGNIEEMGSKDPARVRQVHFVEDVAHVHAQRQIVAAVARRVSPHHATAPASEQRTTRAAVCTGRVASRTGTSTLILRVARLYFSTQSECLRQAQVQDHVGWSLRVIDGKKRSRGTCAGC